MIHTAVERYFPELFEGLSSEDKAKVKKTAADASEVRNLPIPFAACYELQPSIAGNWIFVCY